MIPDWYLGGEVITATRDETSDHGVSVALTGHALGSKE
jgi:hypothetical protein